MAEVYYVGVDVGTASVRAALVNRSGLLQSTAQEPISIWEPQTDHYVQSSTEIWEKCCTVVKVRSGHRRTDTKKHTVCKCLVRFFGGKIQT